MACLRSAECRVSEKEGGAEVFGSDGHIVFSPSNRLRALLGRALLKSTNCSSETGFHSRPRPHPNLLPKGEGTRCTFWISWVGRDSVEPTRSSFNPRGS